MNIYIDMDDVVADFKSYARSVLGTRHNGERFPEHEWQHLRDNPRLYRDLPMKEGANELVEWILAYQRAHPGTFVAFLTAVPRHNDMQWAFNDKVWWAHERFPGIPVFFGPYSHDKWQHIKQPGDILIDDRVGNNEDWIENKGRAHLYRNWPDCKRWLEEELVWQYR